MWSDAIMYGGNLPGFVSRGCDQVIHTGFDKWSAGG